MTHEYICTGPCKRKLVIQKPWDEKEKGPIRCVDCELIVIRKTIEALANIGKGPYDGPDFTAGCPSLGYCGPGMKGTV